MNIGPYHSDEFLWDDIFEEVLYLVQRLAVDVPRNVVRWDSKEDKNKLWATGWLRIGATQNKVLFEVNRFTQGLKVSVGKRSVTGQFRDKTFMNKVAKEIYDYSLTNY